MASTQVKKRRQLVSRDYNRVSIDRSRRSKSPAQQHEIAKRDAARRDWKLIGPEYRDVGSASKHQRQERDDFERLLDDLRADRFGAQILQLWESSRGSRQVGEWVKLIDLLAERRVRVWVSTHKRLYNPRNARDRHSLIEDANDSEYESAKTSDRTRRDMQDAARAGRPHGRFQDGYIRIYDEKTKQLVSQEHDPERAPLIKELFERIAKRHSMYRIERDWEERGILNKSGKPFSQQHLRRLAMSPAYAGLRVVRPGDDEDDFDVDGDFGDVVELNPAAVEYIEGIWEGIVTPELFFDVQAILADPERLNHQDGRTRHLLSMLAPACCCDVCGGHLAPFNSKWGPKYRCQKNGHVSCYEAEFDELVTEVVLEWLSRPSTYELLQREYDSAELQRVRADLAQVKHEILQLAKSTGVGPGKVSVAFAATVEPELQKTKAELQAREKELIVPSLLRDFVGPDVDVAARWKDAVIETKRAVLRLVLQPDRVGQLRLQRSPLKPPLRAPIEDRVEFRREEADQAEPVAS